MYEVRAHTTLESLHEIAGAWDTFACAPGGPSVFGTFEWAVTWWKCSGEGRRLLVLSVWHGMALVAVAPLMTGRLWFGPFPVSVVEFISSWKFAGSAASVLGSMDLAADPAHRDGALDAVLRYIEGERWDLLRLHPLPEQSKSLPRISEWGSREGRIHRQTRVFENAVLLRGDDGFRTHLSSKFRARLRQAGAKLRRRGLVDFTEVTAPGDVPAAMTKIIAIESRSWKWRKGIAINSAVYNGFFEAFALAAAYRGWLRLGFLRLDGNEIAYSLMALTGEKSTFLKTGYDAAHDDCSPGSLMMEWAFDSLAREGAQRIDMFSGDWEYKERWQAASEPHCEVQVFHGGLYPRVLFFLFWRLGLYGKGRTPVLLFKRILRKCGIPWRRSELTRSDQL